MATVLTTAQAVQDVLGDDFDAARAPSLKARMETAAVLVARAVECAAAKNVTLGIDEQELLQRWLAAHFYAVSDKPYQSKTTLDGSASFAGQTGKYLEATLYGQTAVTLDYSGCLADVASSGGVAGGAGGTLIGGLWLGRGPSEQTDYSERD